MTGDDLSNAIDRYIQGMASQKGRDAPAFPLAVSKVSWTGHALSSLRNIVMFIIQTVIVDAGMNFWLGHVDSH